ncbi:hypothetical protein JCM12298_08270 [Desulfothermus naphthae]
MREEKKEIIKNYLLNEKISEEERKERFEIAWDIWENFLLICEDIKKEFFQNHIQPEIKKLFGESFLIRDLIFRDKVCYLNVVLVKRNWLINNNPFYVIKLNHDECGNYTLGLERWINNNITKDILKDILKKEEEIKIFVSSKGKFDSVTQWWKFRKRFHGSPSDDGKLNFILSLLLTPEKEANILKEEFTQLHNLLKEKINEQFTLEEFIDDIVTHYK